MTWCAVVALVAGWGCAGDLGAVCGMRFVGLAAVRAEAAVPATAAVDSAEVVGDAGELLRPGVTLSNGLSKQGRSGV